MAGSPPGAGHARRLAPVAAALLLIILVLMVLFRDRIPFLAADAPDAVTAPAAALAPLVADDASDAPEIAPEAAPDAPETVAPRISAGAIAPDGIATIAGTAAPGSRVEVLVDGAPLAETTATATGEFALVTRLDADPHPRLLTLGAPAGEGGESLTSAESIAVPPITRDDAPASANAALLITDEGAAVLNRPVAGGGDRAQDATAAAAPPDADPAPALAFETLAYPPSGAVQVGGRAPPGARIRLYLDDRLVDEIHAAADGGWQSELPGTEGAAHRLRADLIDENGSVATRRETRLAREEPLARAALAAPPGLVEESHAAPDTGAQKESAAAPDTAAAEAAPIVHEDAAPLLDAAEPQAVTITIEPGHTLWAIARHHFGHGILYVQVFEANHDQIRDPDLIYPGQVFTIPGVED